MVESFDLGTTRPASTAYEYALTAIRSAVLSRRVASGTRLVQSELARQLGTSTTPVREALRDLASEGLVYFDPHRGAVVRDLDVEEVREIYEIRKRLYPLLVERSVGHVSDCDLDLADKLVEQMYEEKDLSAWVELNKQFHGVLASPGRKTTVYSILEKMRDHAMPYVNLSLDVRADARVKSNDEHRRLVELYRLNDTANAIELTLEHLDGTLAIIEEAHEQGRI